MPYGQIVVGPPGAGKSTYCAGLLQFLTAAGRYVAPLGLAGR
jgi:GPN-loop GTPase